MIICGSTLMYIQMAHWDLDRVVVGFTSTFVHAVDNSIIGWQSVLLGEDTGGTRENHQHVSNH